MQPSFGETFAKRNFCSQELHEAFSYWFGRVNVNLSLGRGKNETAEDS